MLFYEYTIGDAQPLMLKMNYLSPVRKLASPLRGATILFVDSTTDGAEVGRLAARREWAPARAR